MGFIGNLITSAGAAIRAFSQSMMHADPVSLRVDLNWNAWSNWDARLIRYDILWSMYQNDSYADLLHAWAVRYKTTYGLYKHIRHLYNPAYRLGNFWGDRLMGGLLDAAAGDGEAEPSALPILTDSEAIRPAIGKLWKDSDWQTRKDLFTRWGACLGDVVLKVADVAEAGQVRLEVLHPAFLKYLDADPCTGMVRGYLIERNVNHPDDVGIQSMSILNPQANRRVVRYQERAYLDGTDVVYQTYLDEKPYGWDGNPPEWRKPYGFVPLRLIQHENLGMDWGASCYHAGLSRFREVDDQGSGLSDQIRKAIRAPMLLAGVRGKSEIASPTTNRALQPLETMGSNPEPSRAEMDFLYSNNVDAKAHHLTFQLPINQVCEHIGNLNKDIEKNYPELVADVGMMGAVTAEAVRNARQLASSKVQARRVNYDAGLVWCQRAALVIGGQAGYPGYEAFRSADLESDAVAHSIGRRAVFELDPLDAIEEDRAFWAAANEAIKAGIPLPLYLDRNGWSKDDLKALEEAKAAEPPPPAPVIMAAAGAGGKPIANGKSGPPLAQDITMN